jgi:hypothetical protein
LPLELQANEPIARFSNPSARAQRQLTPQAKRLQALPKQPQLARALASGQGALAPCAEWMGSTESLVWTESGVPPVRPTQPARRR